jgi:hypothetical protein
MLSVDSTIISECGRYRYCLTREVALSGPVFAFFGVSPSVADAAAGEAAMRKNIGFTRRWGGSRCVVGNIFAFRTTDISVLGKCADPFGPRNAIELDNIIRQADVLVPCWGSRSRLPERLRPRVAWLRRLLLTSGKPVKCLGLTRGGDPCHPLMIGYDTPLVDFVV